ncbi:hypothetical protein ACN42_g5456 [Penicillium freii]|uniref:Uncharacterized protein n=1 Tax=Penicillium freii TaxID=48697 RepID=A0A117NP26_PENFR|nr:hypothetical protein ACN42_g5456 [Penicillium freii]
MVFKFLELCFMKKYHKVDRHSPPLAYINVLAVLDLQTRIKFMRDPTSILSIRGNKKKKKFAGPEEAEFLLANLMVHNQLILLKIQTPEEQAATPETDQND